MPREGAAADTPRGWRWSRFAAAARPHAITGLLSLIVQFNALACNVTGTGLVRFVWRMRIVAGFDG